MAALSAKKRSERAGRLALALAAFAREIGRGAEDPERIDRASAVLAGALVAALERHGITGRPDNATRGRKPVHDRAWAHAALLDEAMLDPDGLPDRITLLNALRRRFEAAGRPVPGETWLKNAVRSFLADAAAFESEAVTRYRTSAELHAVFANEAEFVRFRRARRRADAVWRSSPDVRAQFDHPQKFMEAALHEGFSPSEQA